MQNLIGKRKIRSYDKHSSEEDNNLDDGMPSTTKL